MTTTSIQIRGLRTDHVTSDIEKLSTRQKYKGNDQIHTTSGSGMEISHIGHAIVPTHTRNLHLNSILHVPKAAQNLVSIHHLAKDNSAFLEFYPGYYQGSGHEEHDP